MSQPSGKRAFLALSALAFAICFLVSQYGRAKHLRWLGGWPPLLFVFTVPPEYRFRFGSRAWARDVFIAMTTVTCTGLAIGVMSKRWSCALVSRRLRPPCRHCRPRSSS